MGSDMVLRYGVVIVEISASCNILQHLLSEFVANIGVVAGFMGLVLGLNYGLLGPTRLASVHQCIDTKLVECGICDLL
jgi:hypothetical protein